MSEGDLSRSGVLLEGYLPATPGSYTLRLFIEGDGAILLSGQSPIED